MKGRLNMDLKGLNEGMIINNYRELCNLLGVDIVGGNSKKAQICEEMMKCRIGQKWLKSGISCLVRFPYRLEKMFD